MPRPPTTIHLNGIEAHPTFTDLRSSSVPVYVDRTSFPDVTLSTMCGDVNSISGRVADLNGQVSTVNGRVTDALNGVDAINALHLSDVVTNVGSISTNVGSLNVNVASLNTQMNDATSQLSAVSNNVDATNLRVTTLEGFNLADMKDQLVTLAAADGLSNHYQNVLTMLKYNITNLENRIQYVYSFILGADDPTSLVPDEPLPPLIGPE